MADPTMVPDTGTLTTLLNKFVHVFSPGFDKIGPESRWILASLVTIEIVLSGLAWAAKGQDAHLALAKKLLPIGFITLLVTTWKSVIVVILGGFIWVGMTAGGGAVDYLSDPSAIVDVGMNVCQPIIDFLDSYTTLNPAKAITMAILLGLSLMGILASFFIIALNCFITYLDFYLVSVLSAIFVPFGVFKPTAFLSEKALGGVIGQGVKLMVLTFIMSVAGPVIASISLPAEPTIAQCFLTLLAVGAVMLLSISAPALAGGIMSGSPSLSAGSAAATTLGAAAGLGAAGGAAIGATKAAVTAGSSAARAAARLTGAVSTAGSAGAAAGAGLGIGKVGSALGAVGNVGAMAANKAVDSVKSGAANAAAPLKTSFQQGQNHAVNFAPIKPAAPTAAAATPDPATSPSAAASASAAADAAPSSEAGGTAGSAAGEEPSAATAAEGASTSASSGAANAAEGAAGPTPSAAAADNGGATSPSPGPAPAPAAGPAPKTAKPSVTKAGAHAVKVVETLKQGDSGGGSMSPSLHHDED